MVRYFDYRNLKNFFSTVPLVIPQFRVFEERDLDHRFQRRSISQVRSFQKNGNRPWYALTEDVSYVARNSLWTLFHGFCGVD